MSLGFPTRFGYGVMLGAQLLSLFGRDTQRAFGHLGFTNTLGWADPQRGTAVGIVTSGKPTVYPGGVALPRAVAAGHDVRRRAEAGDQPVDHRARLAARLLGVVGARHVEGCLVQRADHDVGQRVAVAGGRTRPTSIAWPSTPSTRPIP